MTIFERTRWRLYNIVRLIAARCEFVLFISLVLISSILSCVIITTAISTLLGWVR